MNRKQRKIRRRFVKAELKRTEQKIQRVREIIDEVLQEMGRRLYKLKRDDELRLLTLYTWRDRYKVSIKWILRILIPIWSNQFSRYRVRSVSLGCLVPTLVGKKSEEIIREHIDGEFKKGENKREWKANEIARIEKLVKGKKDRRKTIRSESILSVSSVDSFLRKYRRNLKWNKKASRNTELEKVKKKPFRTNPWL